MKTSSLLHLSPIPNFRAIGDTNTLDPVYEESSPCTQSLTGSGSIVGRAVTITLNGTTLSVPVPHTAVTTTISGPQGPLLTGSKCTEPHFAKLEDTAGNVVMYPEIGCSYENQNCCSFGWNESVVLDECAADYTTQYLGTHSACCPKSVTLFLSSKGAHR